jgi:transcriptional regulator with XRE-family HTH domain
METVKSETYHKLRLEIGSQAKVAELLGINIRTLQRREAGELPLNPEAQRSIKSLAASLHMDNLLHLAKDSSNIRSAVKELAELLA